VLVLLASATAASAQPIVFRGADQPPSYPGPWPPIVVGTAEAFDAYVAEVGAANLHGPNWAEAVAANGGPVDLSEAAITGLPLFDWGPGQRGYVDAPGGFVGPTDPGLLAFVPEPYTITGCCGGARFVFRSAVYAFGIRGQIELPSPVPYSPDFILEFFWRGNPVFTRSLLEGTVLPAHGQPSAPVFIGVVSREVFFDEVRVSVPSNDFRLFGAPLIASVPEPATLALVAGGLLLLTGVARRRCLPP
jgi:hypothetical protein